MMKEPSLQACRWRAAGEGGGEGKRQAEAGRREEVKCRYGCMGQIVTPAIQNIE
jgi:hypothetical protein